MIVRAMVRIRAADSDLALVDSQPEDIGSVREEGRASEMGGWLQKDRKSVGCAGCSCDQTQPGLFPLNTPL